MYNWPDAPPLGKPIEINGETTYPIRPERPSQDAYVRSMLEKEFGDRDRGLTDTKRHTQLALTKLGEMVVNQLLAHPDDSQAVRLMFDRLRGVINAIDERELHILRDKAKRREHYKHEYDMTDWEAKGYS